MQVITLTTDMGLEDHYLAVVKGTIIEQCPAARIVDISHRITPFDIAHAAFVLRNAYPQFPAGSTHIIGVDPEVTEEKRPLLVPYDGHFFVGADNGIFSLIFDKQPEQAYELGTGDRERTFPTRSIFAKAACEIAGGKNPESLGEATGELVQRSLFRAVVEENVIRGMIIHIDTYGNVISNITRDLFEEVGQGRPYTINFRGSSYRINKIHQSYSEVPEGEKVALFSSSGHLEIAINKGAQGSGGGAGQLFGLKKNAAITVTFHDHQDR